MGLEKCTRWPVCDLDPRSRLEKNVFVCLMKWEQLIQSLQILIVIAPWLCLIPDQILEKFCWKLIFWRIFLQNFGCVFLKFKHSVGCISGMVGQIDTKTKWKGSALVGYWVNYLTLTSDLTHDLDLVFFKVKLLNSCISGIVGLIDMNCKEVN